MGKKRNCHNKLISSRQMYRMIALNQDLPMEVVQDVMDSFSEVIYLATSEGYKINLPRVGMYYGRLNYGHKKGDVKKISKMIYDNVIDKEDDTVKYFEKDGNYYCEWLQDENDFYTPAVKFHKTFKERCKERSIDKWLQQ